MVLFIRDPRLEYGATAAQPLTKLSSQSSFVLASWAVNKLGGFKQNHGACSSARKEHSCIPWLLSHLVMIPNPTKSTMHVRICFDVAAVLNDGERRELEGIRSSGGYLHCVKCELLKITPDESIDFWAMNLWSFNSLDISNSLLPIWWTKPLCTKPKPWFLLTRALCPAMSWSSSVWTLVRLRTS